MAEKTATKKPAKKTVAKAVEAKPKALGRSTTMGEAAPKAPKAPKAAKTEFAVIATGSWRLAFALSAIGPVLGVLALRAVAEPRTSARRPEMSAIPPAAR